MEEDSEAVSGFWGEHVIEERHLPYVKGGNEYLSFLPYGFSYDRSISFQRSKALEIENIL